MKAAIQHEAASSPAPWKIDNILVPIDFSDLSLKALAYARTLAESMGASVTVVHVVEPIPDEYFASRSALKDARVTVGAKQKLQRTLEEQGIDKSTADPLVRMGVPWQEIVAAAKEQRTGLIIIATHGRTGPSHAFLGSTAERVVQHASCPVLTVR